ncbi:unnamed protein product [Jaminaea pallidilutea]
MVRYCSGECQRQDWERVHFKECRALRWYKKQQTAAGDGGKVTLPNTRIRMLSRMLWSRRVTEKDIGGIAYQDLQSRVSASAHAKEDEKREAQLFERFVAAGEEQDVPLSIEALQRLGLQTGLEQVLTKSLSNAFQLSTGMLDDVGMCISPGLSMLNHSCVPNTAQVFPLGPQAPGTQAMALVAIRDIKPGEELTVTYIDTAMPRSRRQAVLLEEYGFACDCEGCSTSSTVLDPREALWCSRKSCRGWLHRQGESSSTSANVCRCNRCHVKQRVDLESIHAIAASALATIQGQPALPPFKEQCVTSLKDQLGALSIGMAPSSYPMWCMLHYCKGQATAALETADGNDAAAISETCLQLTFLQVAATEAGIDSGTIPLYQRGSPVKAVLLAELGKWLLANPVTSQQESSAPNTPAADLLPEHLMSQNIPSAGSRARAQLSRQVLQQAKTVSQWAFGKDSGGGLVGQEVSSLLQEVEHWLQTNDGSS